MGGSHGDILLNVPVLGETCMFESAEMRGVAAVALTPGPVGGTART
jgi:hypothetical protein